MLVVLAVVTVGSALAPPRAVRVFQEQPAAVCKGQGSVEIADPALLYRDDGKAKVSQLADLPKPDHEKAVLRMIGPCADPLVVRHRVGR